MRHVWVALGLAGCADIPKAPFNDGSLGFDVSSDGAFEVGGSGYLMVFGKPDPTNRRVPMPEKLFIAGHDVLANATTNSCINEQRVGLAFFPGLNITSDDDHLGMMGSVVNDVHQTEIAGPGAVQYDVTYNASYLAGGAATFEHFIGVTTFTFYAGGRIVRHDAFQPFQAGTLDESIAPFGCSPDGTAGLFLTSYWAFEEAGSQQFAADGVASPVNDDPRACTYYAGIQSAIAVALQVPDQAAGQGTRYGVNNLATHVFDVVGTDSSSLTSAGFDVTSAIRVADSVVDPGSNPNDTVGCAALFNDLVDNQIRIDGGAPLSTNADGYFKEPTATTHESAVVLEPANARLPNGFAVLLNLGSSTHADVIREPPGQDPPAYIQRVGDNGDVLFVFRDPLDSGQRVRIEPF